MFGVARSVSEAVGHELLSGTFRNLLAADGCIPNRSFDLAIGLARAGKIPVEAAVKLHYDVCDNPLIETIVRLLVLHHLHLFRVPYRVKQSLCEKMRISLPMATMDPDRKKLRGS